jgi:hypothetical protein
MPKRLPSFYAPVTLDVEGDLTKTRWIGTFSVKRVLTWQDRFNIERFYKEYLADDTSVVDPNITVNAAALAELRVRVQSGPPWWEDSRCGLDLIDKTPIHALMVEVDKAKKQWDKELEDAVKEPPAKEQQ